MAEQALKVRIAEVIQDKFKIESVKKYLYLQDLINKYLNWIKDNQKTSTREQSVLKIFLDYNGNKRINELTTWLIEQYKSKRKKDGLKPNSINRELTVLRSMFNRAVEWDELKTNPVKGVKKAIPFTESEHERKAQYITSEDYNNIIRYANSDLRDFIIVARNTGMRVSEICNLKVSDINLQKEEIFISDSKNYTQRTVPINNSVKSVLMELIKDKDDNGRLFKHHNRDSLGIAFRRLLASLNMRGRY
jgi:integrase